jgi:hypothetical protein
MPVVSSSEELRNRTVSMQRANEGQQRDGQVMVMEDRFDLGCQFFVDAHMCVWSRRMGKACDTC